MMEDVVWASPVSEDVNRASPVAKAITKASTVPKADISDSPVLMITWTLWFMRLSRKPLPQVVRSHYRDLLV